MFEKHTCQYSSGRFHSSAFNLVERLVYSNSYTLTRNASCDAPKYLEYNRKWLYFLPKQMRFRQFFIVVISVYRISFGKMFCRTNCHIFRTRKLTKSFTGDAIFGTNLNIVSWARVDQRSRTLDTTLTQSPRRSTRERVVEGWRGTGAIDATSLSSPIASNRKF